MIDVEIFTKSGKFHFHLDFEDLIKVIEQATCSIFSFFFVLHGLFSILQSAINFCKH